MKRIKSAITSLLAAVISIGLLSGCVTSKNLDPAGVYQGDALLFNADMLIPTAYNIIHEFVSWEKANREALRKIPQIKQTADAMRTEAPGLINSAKTLRDAYALEPTPANRDSLANVLRLLRSFSVEATIHLSQHKL